MAATTVAAHGMALLGDAQLDELLIALDKQQTAIPGGFRRSDLELLAMALQAPTGRSAASSTPRSLEPDTEELRRIGEQRLTNALNARAIPRPRNSPQSN